MLEVFICKEKDKLIAHFQVHNKPYSIFTAII